MFAIREGKLVEIVLVINCLLWKRIFGGLEVLIRNNSWSICRTEFALFKNAFANEDDI